MAGNSQKRKRGSGSSASPASSNISPSIANQNKRAKVNDDDSRLTSPPTNNAPPSVADGLFNPHVPPPPTTMPPPPTTMHSSMVANAGIVPLEVQSGMTTTYTSPIIKNIPRAVGDPLGGNPTDMFELTASEVTYNTDVSNMDKTVIQLVVTDEFFPEVKFVDKEDDLAWDESKDSFCQFFISKCHVPADVNKKDWWKSTKKIILFTMSQTRNDRTTAVKNAFVGKYNLLSECHH